MQLLGVSLTAMAVVSVLIYHFAVKGGVSISMEGGHVKTFKGEEYETVMAVKSKGSDWIGSMPTDVEIETGQLMKFEPLADGRIRLRFLGKYAGRSDGVRVGLSLTDPLKLFTGRQQLAFTDFVLDTLPLSLLAPAVPRRLAVFGFGERASGFPGPGQELYGLDEYHSGDTKDIIWKRVAKSPDETLVARVREANVRDVVRVGVVRFAERGEDRAAWTDLLCEALGYIGKEAFEMGASFFVLYESPPKEAKQDGSKAQDERPPGLTRARATDVGELAELVMSCSVAQGSKEVEAVVDGSDFVITGLRELEDERMGAVISEKPMLLLYEDASPPSTYADRSVIYSGKENLLQLVRKMLER